MTKARTLANLISDNAELADGQISVAEVVGAAPSANPTFTGTTTGTFSGPLTGNVTGNITGNVTGAVTGDVTAPEIDLTAIAKDIADTAVDVFVYDTSKDSDGGAWRKRTQNTSWYNEAASATRGSRKEFPAVAVIVAESSSVTIYDGDDPDLPMWMVFNAAQGGSPTQYSFLVTGSVNAVSAKNGQLSIARVTFVAVDFVGDRASYNSVGDAASFNGANVEQRNDLHLHTAGNSYLTNTAIVSNTINDVAMTVLPNAPIDAATGLPAVTIACATDGGVSVIKDDGTVVDISYVAHTKIGSVHFNSLNHLLFSVGDGNKQNVKVHKSLPTSDQSNSQAGYQSSQEDLQYGNTSVTHDISVHHTTHSFSEIADGALGSNKKLVFIDKNNTDSNYITNFITSTYNTGWMNGDIKLATLSDTDDTNVTGAELVTNGTFDSDISGWTSLRSATLSHSSGAINVTNSSGVVSGMASQAVTLEVGKTYIYQVTRVSGSRPGYARIGTTSTGGFYIANTLSSGTASNTFVATSTTAYISLQINGGSDGDNVVFDNVSVRLAEADRSVNGNGVQVFGTVTKTAVATGADLVGYSGWSTSNYLQQPYNSALDFGTGDFTIMGWLKLDASISAFSEIWSRSTSNESTATFIQITNDQKARIYTQSGGSNSYIDSNVLSVGNWIFYTAVRRGGSLYLYLNGEINELSATNRGNTRDISTTEPLYFGKRGISNSLPCTNIRMALWRASATAPSPEQIAKIYNDEKHLFQAGAQATLYGTSDAVTALAHDDSTDLLHVGTSAGRSVFQGLRRVSNTTDAVGAAISASNGLVAED